ncbi:MAG: ice-binding family protein [Solirubrobacterales bacterium]
MSSPFQFKRARRAGVAIASVFAFLAIPAAAQAAPVNLATVSPFVVLGGSTVTNSGTSVLNGDLGVSPGTALTGFDTAVVNGATHENNGVAKQAQADLIVAYDAAAGQAVPPGNELTGTNLGERTLPAGAYRYTSSAQLTGALTLDAEGDPSAEFVFQIASALTTAPGSSVVLVNGASPCNVYWQVGSSATLDTTTVFQGNLMALTDISLNNGATVFGRMLAREGQVSLINNVLDGSTCGTGSTGSPTSPPPTTGPSSGPGTSGDAPSTGTGPGQAGPVRQTRAPNRPTGPRAGRRDGTAIVRRTPTEACTSGFRATVRGLRIERVVFSLDGKRIDSQAHSPFEVFVRAAPGAHMVRARVTFKDATPAKTMRLPYRACAAALLTPRNGPSQFTG